MDEQLTNLQRAFSGPMSSDQVSLVKDIEAFLEYCVENGLSFSLAISTLAHDINGLLTNPEAKWFVPKVSGYAEKRRRLGEASVQMADDPDVRNPNQQ